MARFPALAVLRGRDGRDLFVVCFELSTRTQSALEAAICVHHITLSVLEKSLWLRCLALLPLAFLL